ncbi:zf-HC2 domain-containing protein [Clostridium sp.]|jgi:hypothetical protein|uniref:zf-HC2 domain-containing protein n=1 Tax=Clostridium sp. TaxID=1506 RepID=UPI003EE97AAF
MKKELTCSIVQDLFPNYIEKLTSEDTNRAVQEHLRTCSECKNTYEQMISDIGKTDKIPTIELKFLKKVKKTRILAATLCVILTVVLSNFLYTIEFKHTIDKTDLSSGITEFIKPFDGAVEAYVLETKEINGTLLASFKGRNHESVNGIAKFIKGINNKYRIVQTKIESSEYSTVVQFYPIEIKDERYIAVSAYNLSDEIKYYGLDYWTYSNSDYHSEDRVTESVKFEVENQQFMEVYKVKEVENLLLESVEKNLHSFQLVETSVYDVDGIEITENFRIPEDSIKNISSGAGKAELFLLYIYILIVLGIGIIMTRYFLIE